MVSDPRLDHLIDEALGKTNDHARTVHLTAASTIKVRPVHWLWEGRIPVGSLTLLGGREGIGKSAIAYTLAADITRGHLGGLHKGQPKAVIVAATEDSWEHTIVPRLMAAHADLTRVFRVDVTTDEGLTATLTLPLDLLALEREVRLVGAAMILLDPLLSRLDAKLDTHKDAEVRQALEPLTSLADRTGVAILGLIHVNKGASTDPLTLLMGSRAFAAVARSVLFVMKDPDDDTEVLRLLGTPKNNLGRTDLPTLAFALASQVVAETDEGEVWTVRLEWRGESDRSIEQAMTTAGEGMEERSATSEAAEWLRWFLTQAGGSEESAVVKKEGARADFQAHTLKRAARRIGVIVEWTRTAPSRTFWILPGTLGTPGTPGTSVVPSVPGGYSEQIPGGRVPSVPSVPSTGDTRSTWNTQNKPPREVFQVEEWEMPF